MLQNGNDAQVENVLAAIRRLIADGPSGPRSTTDRLLLTPDLRVSGPTDPRAEAIPPAPEPLLLHPAEALPDSMDLAPAAPGRLLRPASEVAPVLPAGPSDLSASEPLLLRNALPPAPAMPSDPAAVAASPGAAPELPSISSLHGLAEDRLAAEVVPPVQGPGSTPASALPPEDPDLSDLSSDPGAEEAAQATELSLSEEPGPTSPPPAEPSATLGAAPMEETERPAPDQAPVARDVSAPLTRAGEGRAPDSMGFDPEPSPPIVSSEGEKPSPPLSAGSQAIASWPDEATLRALIAEAVREELRGELGERLTRNLRKIVRREVMQVLALRDS